MADDAAPAGNKRWFPLESNPVVMASYMEKLGMDQSLFSFNDVLSTEDWALAMVSPPVLAVLFLYRIKESSEEFRKEEDERIHKEGQVVSPQVYYMKQTVGNACGTVGLLHAALNNRDRLTFQPGSFLADFYEKTKDKTPDEIADILEGDDTLDTAHESAASEGQSHQIEEGEVDTHFICFIEKDGSLYELDGRKSFPINHGPSTPETLLEDAAKVVEKFIARDPGELRFTIVALNPRGEDDD